jgi:hypothetical protein
MRWQCPKCKEVYTNALNRTCAKCHTQLLPMRASPGDVTWVGPERFKVIRNQQVDNHATRRIGVSYIYLMILRELRIRNCIRVGAPLDIVRPTLQSCRGNQADHTEGAHQLLRELACDDVCIYLLPGLTPEEKAALVYCTSTVTVVPSVYNTVDGLIEVQIADDFLALARLVVSEQPPDNSMLWDRLLEAFCDAVSDAAYHQGIYCSLLEGREQFLLNPYCAEAVELYSLIDNCKAALAMLKEYYRQAAELRARKSRVTIRDLMYWINMIRRNGFDRLDKE